MYSFIYLFYYPKFLPFIFNKKEEKSTLLLVVRRSLVVQTRINFFFKCARTREYSIKLKFKLMRKNDVNGQVIVPSVVKITV